jgi:fructan beta-fructosidase
VPVRPLVHLTPPAAWLNDPNGLIALDGEFHAFYQHNPAQDRWGPMHWGHAVSGDLVRWEHLPIALEPDEHGTIYSGTAVIDSDDTAGFGAGALVAFFTHHDERRECQSLAFSTDRGRTWTKYVGNPVLADADAGPDFRDPKVFRHRTDDGGAHWVMVLAVGHRLRFYRSDDLLAWTAVSEFAEPHAERFGIYECPDLFPVALDGGPEQRWVLSVSHAGRSLAARPASRYRVGHFDGERFVPEDGPQGGRWSDHGADLYALQTWSDAPDDRRLWTGWLNSWAYAERVPSVGWRGGFAIPRQLALVTTADGIALCQWPVAELADTHELLLATSEVTGAQAARSLASVRGHNLDILLHARPPEGDVLELQVAVGDDEHTAIRVDPAGGWCEIDRRRSGAVGFALEFPAVHRAPYPSGGTVRLRVLLDGTSVEVFGANGRVSLTDLVFPSSASDQLRLVTSAATVVERLEVAGLRA